MMVSRVPLLLHRIFVRLCGWLLVLLGRSSASKDAELAVTRVVINRRAATG
jgi:hypothetical protein